MTDSEIKAAWNTFNFTLRVASSARGSQRDVALFASALKIINAIANGDETLVEWDVASGHESVNPIELQRLRNQHVIGDRQIAEMLVESFRRLASSESPPPQTCE